MKVEMVLKSKKSKFFFERPTNQRRKTTNQPTKKKKKKKKKKNKKKKRRPPLSCQSSKAYTKGNLATIWRPPWGVSEAKFIFFNYQQTPSHATPNHTKEHTPNQA